MGGAGDGRAHGSGGFYKTDVALNRVGAYAENFYAVWCRAEIARFGDGAQGDEVAGRGGVGLHINFAG